MADGCPRGNECIICEGDGIKCGQKGVVYLASCVACDPLTIPDTGMKKMQSEVSMDLHMPVKGGVDDSVSPDDKNIEMPLNVSPDLHMPVNSGVDDSMPPDMLVNLNMPSKRHQYVGETSRPVRERESNKALL